MDYCALTKTEYTHVLSKIICPFVYEGFLSIYNSAKNIVKDKEENKVLKIFQQLIREIPKWKDKLIIEETNRIIISSKYDLLEKLLKAVIKSNIVLLSNTINILNQQEGSGKNVEDYLNIPFSKFIHRCYIESAKEIYNSPYLFYHRVNSIDLKRNQKDTKDLIKQSIEEAIRKLLPWDIILDHYLKDDDDVDNVDFDNVLSEKEKNNLESRIDKDLNNFPVEEPRSQSIDKLSYDKSSMHTEKTGITGLVNDVKNKYINNENVLDNEMLDNAIKSDNFSKIVNQTKDDLNREPEKIQVNDDDKYEAIYSNVRNTARYKSEQTGGNHSSDTHSDNKSKKSSRSSQKHSEKKESIKQTVSSRKSSHSERKSSRNIDYKKSANISNAKKTADFSGEYHSIS